jgi:hypothetical protein
VSLIRQNLLALATLPGLALIVRGFCKRPNLRLVRSIAPKTALRGQNARPAFTHVRSIALNALFIRVPAVSIHFDVICTFPRKLFHVQEIAVVIPLKSPCIERP